MCPIRLATLLKEATALLGGESGIDTPGLDARLIAGRVLGLVESDVLLNQDLVVTAEKAKEFFEAISKRVSGVPVSHILCKREFWSMDFTVSSDVLDPRPDTETLVSSVLKIYRNKTRRMTIADLGTGTGCIIIALLSHYKNAIGEAYEKSPKAYRVAYGNLAKHNIARRVRLHRASWEKCNGKFDLIVSNPPYIKRYKIPRLQPEVRFHEPLLALDGGINGTEKYVEIFHILNRCLKVNGRAILEIGEDQSNIRACAIRWGMKFCGYVNDLAGRPRCIVLKRSN
ncbi:MAG: peptide chain release factor N(5)-glutamine methyltransferase [Aaplasma endosymbiont of Hyalomma asiaticum]